MNDDRLIALANQVAERYATLPCHEEAVDAITRHLATLWPLSWRLQLVAHIRRKAAADSAGRLDDAVVEALARSDPHDDQNNGVRT